MFNFFKAATSKKDQKPAAKNPLGEVGYTGLNRSGGYVNEEFIKELSGLKGRKVYREMAMNDDACSAIIKVLEDTIKSTDYRFDPANSTPEAHESLRWLLTVLDDMEYTFDDLLTEALTMLVYGWALMEIVYKVRDGQNECPYNDGTIGLKKVALRSQQSLWHWDIDAKNGDIIGMEQFTPTGERAYIPMSKCVLFRTKTILNNPEGMSVLRNAYRPYHYKKRLQEFEAIGYERDLTGIPIMYVPSSILASEDQAAKDAIAAYQQIVRDVRYNEHGGVILPSDPYADVDGRMINMKMVHFELLSSPGNKVGNVDTVIKRYDAAIARTVLADFLMLGQSSSGSFALSKSKTTIFINALESIVKNVVNTINKQLIKKLWLINGFELDIMPRLSYGNIAPADLDEIGKYVRDLAASGVPVAGDMGLENYLRETAGFPTATEPDIGLDLEGAEDAIQDPTADSIGEGA